MLIEILEKLQIITPIRDLDNDRTILGKYAFYDQDIMEGLQLFASNVNERTIIMGQEGLLIKAVRDYLTPLGEDKELKTYAERLIKLFAANSQELKEFDASL